MCEIPWDKRACTFEAFPGRRHLAGFCTGWAEPIQSTVDPRRKDVFLSPGRLLIPREVWALVSPEVHEAFAPGLAQVQKVFGAGHTVDILNGLKFEDSLTMPVKVLPKGFARQYS
jgi:hypothetical protein